MLAVCSADAAINADLIVDMEIGVIGDIIPDDDANGTNVWIYQSSHGLFNKGWRNGGAIGSYVGSETKAFGIPVIVAGTTYTGIGTRCLEFRTDYDHEEFIIQWRDSSQGYSPISLAFFLKTDLDPSQDGNWAADLVNIYSGSGYAICQYLHNTDTGPHLLAHAFAGNGSYINIQDKTWYLVTMKLDCTTGILNIRVYNETSTPGIWELTGTSDGAVNASADGAYGVALNNNYISSTGGRIYMDNLIVDTSTATFPLLPIELASTIRPFRNPWFTKTMTNRAYIYLYRYFTNRVFNP